MEKKKPIISIGIVAHNEGQNIASLIHSILAQRTSDVVLTEILVCSDGSTDDTVKKVQALKNKKIKLIIGKKRIGKSHYLNKIFSIVKGDIIVLFDADVIVASKNTIQHLILPIRHDKKVGLVGGNPQPVEGKTFIEKAVNASFRAYDPLRTQLNGGNNIYGCDGRILALPKIVAKKIHVPENIFANDAFLYFSIITMGYQFRHVRSAKVWFRSPANIADQVRQNKRFVAAHYLLEHMFGEIVPQTYAVPKKLLYSLMFNQFLKMPLHTIAIFFINLYCKYKARNAASEITAKWPIALSTKGGILHG